MKPFLYLVIISALVIAATAALFSITGIATAFSGHFLQVAIMAGAIEAGKIVVASVLYRYWKTMAWIHKSYLTVALVVLMVITSIGIFGYLSEAYQTNRADFIINEKQANILENKKTFFIDRKDRLKADKELELKTKISNQTRADSLSSRGQSITRTRIDIKDSETKIVQLEQQISAMEDSIGSYDLQIINLQSKNEKSELGPLTYIASALNMKMDDVIKWFILILVFVFDPLAVALIVAANMIYLKKTGTEHHDEQPEFTEHFVNKAKDFKGILKTGFNFNPTTKIKISSEDIKPEISNVVDKHFDELIEQPIKTWEAPEKKYTRSEIKKIEKKMEEEVNKLDPMVDILFPLEVDPADENAKILDNKQLSEKPKINVSEPISNDIGKIVKEGAEIIKQEEPNEGGEKTPLDHKKEPIIRRWKSTNWRELE